MNREELLKVGKPILFNTEMVKAILDGRKTCTRRVVKPQPNIQNDGNIDGVKPQVIYTSWENFINHKAPYQLGDILYVRETWCKVGEDVDIIYFENSSEMYNGQILYRADGIDLTDIGKWHPSIHMRKELARIFLKVTDVRVERLQDMSIQDMIAEGVKASDITTNRGVIEYRVINRFEELWNSTTKKKDLDKYGFGADPWVWVIEFEKVEVE